MSCNRLFRTENVYAYFDAAAAQVTVVADVWLNPFTDHCHICPNPIAMPPGALEFLVEGETRRGGVHPDIVVNRRISFTFTAATAPASVVVYSMGVDSPSRQTVTVLKTPPPAFQLSTAAPTATAPQAPAPVAPAAATALKAGEVVGYSADFSFDEALQDAIAKAAAMFPSPPRNPDVAISVEVTKIFARAKGNIQSGLYLTAIAK